MTQSNDDTFKSGPLPFTTYNDKGEPVMDIKGISSGKYDSKQKAAKKRPNAHRGNPSADTIITPMAEDELREQIIKVLGLDEMLNGQLVPPFEDLQADWTWTVNDVEKLVKAHNRNQLKSLKAKLPSKIHKDYPVTKEYGIGWDGAIGKVNNIIDEMIGE